MLYEIPEGCEVVNSQELRKLEACEVALRDAMDEHVCNLIRRDKWANDQQHIADLTAAWQKLEQTVVAIDTRFGSDIIAGSDGDDVGDDNA